MKRLLVLFAFALGGCAHQKPDVEVASSLVTVARELVRKGDPESAKVVLANAKRLDPQSPEFATLSSSSTQAAAVPQAPQTAIANPERVSLPYAFIRHGVEIGVNSVEFSSEGQLLVDITLQEKRGRSAELVAAKLFDVQTSSGEKLGCLQRTAIRLRPNEQLFLTVHFAKSSDETGQVELHFPTGKWWKAGGG